MAFDRDHLTSPGSLAALARQLQFGIDPSSQETTLPTATVVMILDGLIALAEPGHEAMLRQRIEQHMAGVITRGNVENARDVDA